MRLSAREWGDLAVAVIAVARARLAVHFDDPLTLIGKPPVRKLPAGTDERVRCERVGRAIRRAARLVPWRCDCLVQALAARQWLSRFGVDSSFTIGARRAPGFEAHAWLTACGTTVVGGDISGFAPLEPRR